MIAITNGKFFKNGSLITNAAVLMADGLITAITEGEIPAGYTVEDAKGALIAPGFIDLQIYGSGGNLFSAYPTVETLRQMDEHLISKGTTGFLVCLATNSLDIFAEAIQAAKAYRHEAKAFLGLHLEGPFLNPKRLGAHPIQYVHKATLEEVKRLLDEADGVVRMMTLAAELQDEEVINYLLSQGIVLSLGHSDANFEQANQAFADGFTTSTHLFNAMPPIHHRNPNLPAAILNHPSAMASIIADGAHVDFEMVKLSYKMMQERLFLITDAVTACDIGPYQHILNGDRFVMPDGTISGSNITLRDAVSNCVNHCGIPPHAALAMASAHPAAALQIQDKYGEIAPGKTASLLLLSDEFVLQKVFVAGVEHLISIN
ncbi:N-acetylglucosamine-6-phosphate deacetylase [Pedobacter westerhofensis]|uniref:N-acetylglucosamine-6-phosphate deacetylase n=1 Tax=Pedobacter westerhofensis TaxID=425512 RepID=A0A521EJW6_9SPHI|nr:N-acetylglucosamine-6-phosphate deacetylase [Pedobacter westerhofensis]SMO84215.1 N-acetylglucosamine-6-phosphate deacetylase [Pedobacter westerhofensis]